MSCTALTSAERPCCPDSDPVPREGGAGRVGTRGCAASARIASRRAARRACRAASPGRLLTPPPDADSDVRAGLDADSGSRIESDSDSGSRIESDSGSRFEPGSRIDSGTACGSRTGSGSGSRIASDTDFGSGLGASRALSSGASPPPEAVGEAGRGSPVPPRPDLAIRSAARALSPGRDSAG
ncbi:hypothetical protein [Streptomyces sp. NPDC013455]|uniref:hypothetical protein n=1 Tax=Streptomyces sp. NPDC013455 TaxID=3155605 RepID=UPI00340B3CA0